MSLRVVFYAMGYRGDVLPFVPVAREIAGRGHDVRFVCPREFHPLFQGEPFRCVHAGTDFGPELLDQHAAFVARWGTRFGGAMLPRLYFDKLTLPNLDAFFDVIDAETASADLVVSHPFSFLIAGPSAERHGVPAVVLDCFPMLRPSRYGRPPLGPALPPVLTNIAWRIGRSRAVQMVPSFAGFRNLRKRLGLSVDGWNFFDACTSSLRTIGLFSTHYQPRLADWPESYRIAGFTPWFGPTDDAVPADVEAFLSEGEPPVLVTLGSNAAAAHHETFIDAARALDAVGARGLLLTSRREIADDSASKIGTNHGVWPFVPLGAVLHRCSAVVHAGGIGTVGAVLAAGIPSAVSPAVTDQVWHARRLTQLRVGFAVPKHGLNDAMHRLVHDAELARDAAAFGDIIRRENGPDAAAELALGALSD